MPEKRFYRTKLIPMKLAKAKDVGHDISYQDIAEATELSYMTVHRYATKQIPRPDYETVARLATYFGVPIEEFVYEETDPGQIVGEATATA
ncbi:helix-turn-helix domain-containing protein [Aggregatilinea lenta]|uniref:helix-turn-helix domain-containing protein n=1 Tax=Aggregatilinea lenta TaxID=913108 RepID=UPI000E5AA8BF|nr:helix-turn-helix transcriptional regulator [Aggregatilinea lenta]